jgi:hypothetical protein
MKKTLLNLATIALAFTSSFAQTTLTQHFEWALTDIQNPKIAVYSWGTGGANGFVAGNNTYGDIASVQLFDYSTGIVGPGTVSNLKVWIPIKTDNGGSINLRIYANNAGAIGTQLASVSVDIADIDTSAAGLMPIAGSTAGTFRGFYNVEVNFTTPVAFTGSGFWGAYTFGTGTNVISGMTTDDVQASYPFASTHSGVIASNNAFDNYGQYDLHIAHAIYPTVTMTPSSVVETSLEANMYAYDNSLYITTYEDNTFGVITITNMMGQTVETISHNGNYNIFNLNHLSAGIYVVTLTTPEGKSSTQKITIK